MFVLCWDGLTRFGFGALFNAALRESFTRPLSSMPMHLTQMMSPTLATSSVRFTRKSASSEMCTSHPCRENFDKRAEFFSRDNATLVRLADLYLTRHATDNFFRARHAFAARRVDVHRAVVLDVNFSAGLRDNAFDGLAAGSNQRADLLRINLMVSMRGAYFDNSGRGLSSALRMMSRILVRASFARSIASAMIL